MTDYKRIAIDTSKSVFTLHGVDGQDRPVLRRELRRPDLARFFEKLSPTEVVLEACGGSHHWGRTLQALGHGVRLIPPQYVKPFVKRGKNDRNDAEAISEAASRPGMRSVAVKSAEQQAQSLLLSVRELLVRQRTQLVNALRGHAAEFGLIAPVGDKGLAQLLADVASDASLPGAAAEALALLGKEIARLEARLAEIDAKLIKQHKATPTSQLLAGVPGVGPMGALSLTLRVDPKQFRSGRHFAAPAFAGAGYGAGQQDGPHRVGHDDERRGIPPAESRRLTRSSAAGAGHKGRDADRSIRRSTEPA